MTERTVRISDVVGGGYNEFWQSKKRYRVLKGGKGSKKSTTTALNYILRLMKYPESNLLVVRQVMNTHRDSTFAQLKWAQEKLGVSHLWQNNISPLEMTYTPTGQKILFRGFDDVLKLASTTVSKGYLCWVWIEEAFEIQSEADFDKLDLSAPRGEIAPGLFKQTTLTFNPWSETHWLKRRFFDNPDENTDVFTTTYICNEFLDDTDKAVFERMRTENPRKYAVAGLGEWGISEGLIYEKWRVEAFNRENIGITVNEDGKTTDYSWKFRHIFGLDYGYTNDPTAFIAAAVSPELKLCYIYDEHYERKMLNSDIANMITGKGYRKERIIADAAEPKSNDELHRLGLTRVAPCKKGADSIIHGISVIQEYTLIVHPDCKNTIAELSAYCWDTKNDKALNKPIDDNNHLMDALRYAFEDIKNFNPVNPGEKKRRDNNARYYGNEIVTANDINGGWY